MRPKRRRSSLQVLARARATAVPCAWIGAVSNDRSGAPECFASSEPRAVRLIVTRPAAQAGGWVEALREAGIDAAALPLLRIEPVADPTPLHAAWQRLGGHALVVFVSANAVQQFFAARPPGCTWPAALRAGATGAGTVAALRAAGVPEAAIVAPAADAASDSEALWARLAGEDWSGRRVLTVRGEDGRDWLAETLRGRGAEPAFVAAYRRLPPVLDEAGRGLLAAAVGRPADHAWLFSSSEAARNLGLLAPQAGWAGGRAMATHARIADAARQLGFGHVLACSPTPAAVAAAMRELAAGITDGVATGGRPIQ